MKLSLGKIEQELRAVVKRFPSSCFAILLVAILFFFLLHDVMSTYQDYVFRATLSGILFFFLSTARVLFCESLGENSKPLKKGSIIVPIALTLAFFLSSSFGQSDDELFTFFFFTLAGTISILFFAPYVLKLRANSIENPLYYSYFYSVSSALFMATITGLSAFILGAIGITAVETLFDVSWRIMDDMYGDMAIFSFTLLAPLFGLSRLPKKETFLKDSYLESLFFSFLLKFIALPSILLYFVILYTYSAKVLLNFSDWPKGEVSWLVIGFSLFGYLTYIFSYIFEEKHKAIKIFRKVFPYIVLPQIAMLFYAIYLRIYQYDLTTNRYFVVLFGVFLLIISLYYVLSREKKLLMIPSTLCLFTVIFSIGPWSVYSLPETRQLARLESNLVEANILQGNTIVPLEDILDINEELSSEIYGGISYLCGFDDCKSIKKLFPDQYGETFRKHIDITVTMREDQDISRWQIVSGVTELIKVEMYNSYRDSRISFDIGEQKALNISGYEVLYHVGYYQQDVLLDQAYIDVEKELLIIYENANEVESISMTTFLDNLRSSDSIPDYNTPLEYMTLEGESEIYFYKLILRNLTLNTEPDSSSGGYANGYLLLRKK